MNPNPKVSENPGREEAIFEAARELTSEQCAAYLSRVCGTDAALRQRLEILLQANSQAGDFLEPAPQQAAGNPTIDISAEVIEKPGDTIGRYKIREKLGEGGCGVVYVAEQAEPVRRRVALKIIKLGMDTRSVIARFDAERQALAMMDHPNIAKVLDAGATDTGRPYFVMELVRGIKITEYCDQNNLDTTRRLALFIQVCHAIQHAHQKGVIHRDIKPSNILVTLHDGVPVPKVIDFGIAKATEGRLTDLTVYTELHQFIGTPVYMSPEQAEMSGLDIDTRSDIYCLGVLLYELLTGRTPFEFQELLKSGLDEMRRTIREKEPPRPSTRLSTMIDGDLTCVAKRHGADPPKLIHFIRGELDWIVMKSLEKDRTRRYETANALAADVQRFLKNEPVEACPPSNLYRFQKMVRRNKTVFVASAAVTGALLFGLGLSLYLFIKEKQAYHRAVDAERQQAALRDAAEKGWALEKRMREVAPIAEQLTSVGYLLSAGQLEKADELMSKIPPIVPQSSAVYNVIGDLRRREGNWQAAITNYQRSIQADPTNPLNLVAYHTLGPLLVQVGEQQAYAQYRQRVVQLFGKTSAPGTAGGLARDCLLVPPPVDDLNVLADMADTALKVGTTDKSWPAFQLVKALTEYRQKRFPEATERLGNVLGGPEGTNNAMHLSPAQAVEGYALLAMCESGLKRADDAQATLAKATQIADAKLATIDEANWSEQTIARLLLHEAKAFIPVLRSGSTGSK